jgi:hypothetical protein
LILLLWGWDAEGLFCDPRGRVIAGSREDLFPTTFAATRTACKGYRTARVGNRPGVILTGIAVLSSAPVAWHLANTQRVKQQVTLTTVDLIAY